MIKLTAGLSVLLFFVGHGAPVAMAADSIPSIKGLSYQDARKALIGSGWQPAITDKQYFPVSPLARNYLKAGFAETNDCSAGQSPQCIFYFKDSAGANLLVTTAGQADPENGKHALVDNYLVVHELPDRPASGEFTSTPIDALGGQEAVRVKKYFTDPSECKDVKAAPYFMVLGNGIYEDSPKFNALVKLIQSGSYTINGYHVKDGACYAEITVDGVYQGTTYRQNLNSLLSGSI